MALKANASSQEIMNAAVRRLTDGNGPAFILDEDNPSIAPTCVYLDRDTGNKCVVGALLPDGVIDKVGDYMGTALLLWQKNKELLPDWFEENLDLLSGLQAVHDDRNHWNGNVLNESGKAALGFVARWFDLKIPDELYTEAPMDIETHEHITYCMNQYVNIKKQCVTEIA